MRVTALNAECLIHICSQLYADWRRLSVLPNRWIWTLGMLYQQSQREDCGTAKTEHYNNSKSSDLVSHRENRHFMHLKALTDCPVCFRIQFETVLLVFQTTPSLLGLLSSLSPGDGGALPFPPVCLLNPSNRLLTAESRTASSHRLPSRTNSLYMSHSHSPF